MRTPSRASWVGRSSRRRGIVATVTVVALAALAGCVPVADAPAPTPTVTASPTPTPTPEPDPVLVVGGTAGQNRPYFEFVLGGLVASTAAPTSQEIFSALVNAGFDPAAIEVTADRTRVNDPADSILIGVLIDGQCLLGQVIDGEVAADLADVLGTGRCLVGRTASLD